MWTPPTPGTTSTDVAQGIRGLAGSSSFSSRNGKVDKEKVLREVQDNIKRIPCDIPQQVREGFGKNKPEHQPIDAQGLS